MSKHVSLSEATSCIKDGMTVMVGGFMSNGTPELLMDGIVDMGIHDLTVIANDSGTPGSGVAKLIAAGAVKHLIATHIGLNPQAGQKMNDGSMQVTLIPQGTLAEQIRAAGAGLGGVLTPTGLNTDVSEGKEIFHINGQDYLLELPLHADVALLGGSIVDEAGNIFYKGTTRNFNPLMATAADVVIVAAEELVETGSIEPENIHTPGIFVDYIVGGKNV